MNEHDWTHVIVHHPDYANKLGIVTAEWSALELHLCFLFQNLLGVGSERAEAVFFTLTNNRTRREVKRALPKFYCLETMNYTIEPIESYVASAMRQLVGIL